MFFQHPELLEWQLLSTEVERLHRILVSDPRQAIHRKCFRLHFHRQFLQLQEPGPLADWGWNPLLHLEDIQNGMICKKRATNYQAVCVIEPGCEVGPDCIVGMFLSKGPRVAPPPRAEEGAPSTESRRIFGLILNVNVSGLKNKFSIDNMLWNYVSGFCQASFPLILDKKKGNPRQSSLDSNTFLEQVFCP